MFGRQNLCNGQTLNQRPTYELTRSRKESVYLVFRYFWTNNKCKVSHLQVLTNYKITNKKAFNMKEKGKRTYNETSAKRKSMNVQF